MKKKRYFRRRALASSLKTMRRFPTPLTPKPELVSLIRKLHPIGGGRELLRLGPPGDGGYLIPNDLEGIEACFSPGVSSVSGFEMDCAAVGMEVFLADRSVDGPAEFHQRFHFTKKFVGATSSENFMTMDDWVASSLSGSQSSVSRSDLLLQIDIEGFEYETFLSMTDSLLRRFRIIVAEFHDLDMLWSRPFFRLASRVFEKLLQSHACVHIHPNNHSHTFAWNGLDIPLVMEFTFLRLDRLESSNRSQVFPHPLDHDNNSGAPPLVLPSCWYLDGE